MHFNVVYVTVGSTKFDDLIKNIVSDNVLYTLSSRHCKKLIVQHGNSPPVDEPERILKKYGIKIEQYTFRPNEADLASADLIIGHAGAGTCLDILYNKKKGLIVVNDCLMDNHQLEVAQQLADEGFLYYCTVSQMAWQLGTLDFATLKQYVPMQNMDTFIEALNDLMEQ